MERYQEVMVALWECVMYNGMKRPLAEKSRWRHIQLAIKHRYLENHSSKIKIYYWTLLGSHGRSFRIRHENVRAAPPGGGLAMTSYLVENKTSSSRRPCIADKKLLWNAVRKSWLLFQNPSWKRACSAPWLRTDDDLISGWQWNLIISETYIADKKLLYITIRK